MWTPKRIVLLAFGVVLFFAGYMVYSSCLGGIDGLPPLPDADWPNPNPLALPTLPPSHSLKLDEKLVLAFGPDCRELKWPLKLEMNQKSMVVAANEFHIEDDGRLKLDNMSVALFGKDPGDGRGVEINTVRADTAYLTFDKPLKDSEKELGGNRRVVAAELTNHIEIVNNHRTPQRDDDLHLIIDKGPLFFDEAKRLIWTDDDVHVEDDQSKPRPNEVRGQGMEVHLAAAEPDAKPMEKPAHRGKARTEAFSGVERIVLLSGVDMNLYVAGDFLSGPAAGKEKAAAADAPKPRAKPDAPPDKAHVNIYTPGRFEYLFHKDGDVALFDAPEADPRTPPRTTRTSTSIASPRRPTARGSCTTSCSASTWNCGWATRKAAPAPTTTIPSIAAWKCRAPTPSATRKSSWPPTSKTSRPAATILCTTPAASSPSSRAIRIGWIPRCGPTRTTTSSAPANCGSRT